MKYRYQHIPGSDVEGRAEFEPERHGRRRFLGAALGSALVTSSIVAWRKSALAGEDGDNSGPGGDDDDDNSGHGGGGDNDHGLPPEQSEQFEGVTTVEIIDERFVPNNVRIETGQTVTWVNRDDDDHTASGRGMDTGVMSQGSSGTVAFLEPGDYAYTCNFHPEMLGLVSVVGESKGTPVSETRPLPTEVTVRIVDLAFEPDQVQLAVGGTVTWRNVGDTPHTVTGDFGDSDILDPGAEFSWNFEETGYFDYQCALHSGMQGTISVEEQREATPVSGTPESVPESAEVEILDFGFDPPEVTIAAGGKVTWTNRGAVAHTVTGESVDSDILDAGATFEWTFNEPGRVNYQCILHGGMQGTVNVA